MQRGHSFPSLHSGDAGEAIGNLSDAYRSRKQFSTYHIRTNPMKSKALTTPDGYKTLVRKVARELADLEFLVKQRTAEIYWTIGKHIHEHLLAHEQRAEYGTALYIRLAKDVDRDISTLQRSVQFYRTYPISAAPRKLTWEHYKSLVTIKDDALRKKLEEKVVRQEWNTNELRNYLSTKRKLISAKQDDKSVPQLVFTRGKLHTYQIIEANKPLAAKSPLVIDLGFREEHRIPKNTTRFKKDDFAELIFEEEELIEVKKVTVSKDELFTYKAYVNKIIDGDTLIVAFDFQLDNSVSQKLRLRGIDCPEIDTEEGQRARRFVESRLKDCEFVIVKTCKDRSDKYDRYLADVFYLPRLWERGQAGETDPARVAAEGKFLNQELLDEHLAFLY